MRASDILSELPATRTHREELYQEFHRHPELSMREYNTVASIEKKLADVSIPSQHVGETGLIVALENGDGPVVALRGDIDDLPVREDSGVPYASVDMEPASASEDFSVIPRALGVPYLFWGLGGFADPASAPGNRSPAFCSDFQPTLDRGVEALMVAAFSVSRDF